jgi:hypothetical protein
MVILTLILIEIMLTSAVSALEKKIRLRMLTKWAKGEMTMKELLWLKRQPWFQKAFLKKHEVSAEKKDQ